MSKAAMEEEDMGLVGAQSPKDSATLDSLERPALSARAAATAEQRARPVVAAQHEKKAQEERWKVRLKEAMEGATRASQSLQEAKEALNGEKQKLVCLRQQLTFTAIGNPQERVALEKEVSDRSGTVATLEMLRKEYEEQLNSARAQVNAAKTALGIK
eukprot:TRINITY_DN19628_c0_g3_i1.p2 TRINITY_DN19628_c0_g3~~TRINITY_DN19628_c0_g3_i1.p2  ORF type:complete len:158 (+),score=36.35 TRINITY_DN19628_c0_g3_i1:422-895(+)